MNEYYQSIGEKKAKKVSLGGDGHVEGIWRLDLSSCPTGALFDRFHLLRYLRKLSTRPATVEYGRLEGKPRTLIKSQKYTLLAHPQNCPGSARKHLKRLPAATKLLLIGTRINVFRRKL
jgi:hypothetical protein